MIVELFVVIRINVKKVSGILKRFCFCEYDFSKKYEYKGCGYPVNGFFQNILIYFLVILSN